MESGDLAVTASGQGGATAGAQLVTMASLSGGYRDRAEIREVMGDRVAREIVLEPRR
jgi:hypothetical protein